MGLKDIFRATEYRTRMEALEEENAELRRHAESEKEELEEKNAALQRTIEEQNAVLTDEHRQAIEIQRLISAQKEESKRWDDTIFAKKCTINDLERTAAAKREEIVELEKSKVELEDEILLQDFGLYKPMYDFASSKEYKDRLQECRDQQKEMIKSGDAAICSTQWAVNGNLAKGRKMTNDNIKQTIIVFNTECENAISKVTFSNFESMKKRIDRIYEKLDKLNEVNEIYLSYMKN